MRFIHPAALIGLFLNLLVAYFLYSLLGQADLSPLTGEDRELAQNFISAMDAIKPLHLTFLAGQALGLALMVLGKPFGLAIGAFSSLFTMPLGLVYLYGALVTNYRVKYAAFDTAAPGAAGARFVFRSTAERQMMIFASIGVACFVLFTLFQKMDMAVSFLAIAIMGAVCLLRARKQYALTLHDEFLTLSPGLFAPRLQLAFADMRSATLTDDEKIVFDMNAGPGQTNAPFMWALKNVEPGSRRAAVEEMGALLAEHNVPLY